MATTKTPTYADLHKQIAAHHQQLYVLYAMLATLDKAQHAEDGAAQAAEAKAEKTVGDHCADAGIPPVPAPTGKVLVKKEEEAKAEPPHPALAPIKEATVSIPTVDEVRAALVVWAKANGGNGAALKFLADEGFKNCTQIPEGDRARMLKKIQGKG